MQQPKEVGTHENQMKNVVTACEQITKIIKAGHNLVLTSGNGPQVGAIKLQNQSAAEISPEMPLFCCGAMSQGLIGYWMVQGMRNALAAQKLDRNVACILSQTLVALDDPAFKNPTKPVGRFYTKEEADALTQQGKIVKEDAGRGYRVVVASPRPQHVMETPVVEQMVAGGTIVISTNGGGVPVVRQTDGTIVGVDAVIDKDLASSLMARELKVDVLMILTDVTNACINYRKDNEEKLGDVKLERMQKLEAEGHFAAGSMKPKICAAMEFVEATGGIAIITSLNSAVDALEGKCGTRITK